MFRWFVLAIVLAMIGVAASHVRGVSQTAPKMRMPLARVLAAVPFFASIVAYLANPDWMAWASLGLPNWVRWVGVALGASAVVSMYWVMANFARKDEGATTPQLRLITNGPYRWVRHPMYVVDMMFATSVGLMAANGFILLWAAMLSIAVRLIVVPWEETRLIEIFGEVYRRYQSRTGSFLPFALRGKQRSRS